MINVLFVSSPGNPLDSLVGLYVSLTVCSPLTIITLVMGGRESFGKKIDLLGFEVKSGERDAGCFEFICIRGDV